MTAASTVEDLLRELAPQVLGAVARRYGDLADAEDAVQEALLAAARQWPAEGLPDKPAAWLTAVASRRMTDRLRREDARRRREVVAASREPSGASPAPAQDDSLLRPASSFPSRAGRGRGSGIRPARGSAGARRRGRRLFPRKG